MEAGNPLLDDFVLELTGKSGQRSARRERDAGHYIVRFFRHFSADKCEATHLSLFRRERAPADPREHLLAQDLIYVGGGSVTSLVGVLKAHGIDVIPDEVFELRAVPALRSGRL
jgi:peptidase E